jgi:hypothetical protein
MDGQVLLIRLVHLQTDNFRLFLRPQTDDDEHDEQTVSGLREIA